MVVLDETKFVAARFARRIVTQEVCIQIGGVPASWNECRFVAGNRPLKKCLKFNTLTDESFS